jgi:hypothetical protein
MPKYSVEVTRSITCTIEVEVMDGPAGAYNVVNDRDFALPPRDRWQGSKDWEFVVYDDQEREVGRDDGSGFVESDPDGDEG